MRAVRYRWVALLAIVIAAAAVMPSPHLQAQVGLGLPGEPSETAQKLKPSAELKAAMRTIRKQVLDSHTLITHRRMPRNSALTLKNELLRATEPFAQEAETTPPLKEILTLVIIAAAEIGEPQNPEDQFEGLSKLETALERYPMQFDDPDWQPLR